MPDPGDVHVNGPLTNILIAYMQKAENFVADRVFPIVPSQKQSDIFFTYDKSDWNRDDMQERAPAAETMGGTFDINKAPPFHCRVFGYHKDVPDQLRANEDSPISLDRDATTFVGHKVMLQKENRWVDTYFKAGVWGTDYTPGNLWDTASGDPIKDVAAARLKVMLETGLMPNKLVLGPDAFEAVKNHAAVLERIKYTQRGIVTRELLAALFEVDEVLVPFGIVDTSKKGKAASRKFLFGKHALLAYAAPAPSLLAPSGGYIFSWSGYVGAGRNGARMKRYYMQKRAATRVEAEIAYDMQLVASDCRYFFNAVVS